MMVTLGDHRAGIARHPFDENQELLLHETVQGLTIVGIDLREAHCHRLDSVFHFSGGRPLLARQLNLHRLGKDFGQGPTLLLAFTQSLANMTVWIDLFAWKS